MESIPFCLMVEPSKTLFRIEDTISQKDDISSYSISWTTVSEEPKPQTLNPKP